MSLADLVEHDGQAGDGSQEGTQNLRQQSVLGGQFAESVQLFSRQHTAFDDAALDLQQILVLLGKLADNTSRGDGSPVVQAREVVPLSSSSNWL